MAGEYGSSLDGEIFVCRVVAEFGVCGDVDLAGDLVGHLVAIGCTTRGFTLTTEFGVQILQIDIKERIITKICGALLFKITKLFVGKRN